MVYALLGLLMGLAVALFFRLGQGRFVKCPSCGKRHWISYKVQRVKCQKCGTPLFKGERHKGTNNLYALTAKKKPARKN